MKRKIFCIRGRSNETYTVILFLALVVSLSIPYAHSFIIFAAIRNPNNDDKEDQIVSLGSSEENTSSTSGSATTARDESGGPAAASAPSRRGIGRRSNVSGEGGQAESGRRHDPDADESFGFAAHEGDGRADVVLARIGTSGR